MSNERIRELLPDRAACAPDRTSIYERLAFREQDRERILELMKTRHLVFDHQEGGIIVPDRLKSADLSDQNAPDGSWKYFVDFLPEKVFLRFIAEQYDSLEQHANRFFRNQLDWRTTGGEIRLEAHYSPPGNSRPYILIRAAAPERPDAKTMVDRVKILFDEIYRKERFRDVKSELVRVGIPDQPHVSSPIVSRSQGGLARVKDRAFPLLEALKLFFQIGDKCLKTKNGAFSFKQEANEGLGENEHALRTEMIKVSKLFHDYFVKYGHPDHPTNPDSFETQDHDEEAWPAEKVIHCKGRSRATRICEPYGRWAWDLTKQWFLEVGFITLNDPQTG